MASFTDNPNIQFKEYVSQAPLIETMGAVGRQKQQLYDQGYQRIQGQIDQVAGMDIANPAGKEYLQSKLNELQGNLRKVSAGDFSNYQLVNSIGGMVSSIAKDKNVQNAVSDTVKFRKDLELLNQAKKEGKSSVQNEAYFSYQASPWLSSNDINQRYNAEYVPYTDMDSKLRQLVKDIPEMENSADLPFVRNEDGSFQRDAAGRPVVDGAMMRTSVKGKSAQKIMENFMASLDENDIRQLDIDGWHHYRGATKESFKKDIVSTATQQKQMIKDRVVDLSVALKNDPKLTTEEKSKIQAQINNYNKSLSDGTIDNEMQKNISEIDRIENFESYKQKLYTQKFLTGLANATAYESRKETLETNPYMQTQLAMQNLQLQYDRLRQDNAHFNTRLDFDRQKQAYDLFKAGKDNSLITGPAASKPLPTDLSDITLEGTSLEIQGLTESMKIFRNENAKLIFGPEAIKNKESWEVEQMFRELYNQNNVSPNPALKPDVKRAIETYRQMDMQYMSKVQGYLEVANGSKKFDQAIKNIVKNEENAMLQTWNEDIGEYETLVDISPENLTKLYLAKEKYTQVAGADPGSKSLDAKAFRTEFYGTALEKVANQMSDYTGNSTVKSFINEKVDLHGKKYAKSLGDIFDQKQQYEATELAKRRPELQSTAAALNTEDKNTQWGIDATLGVLGEIAATQGLDLNKKDNFNADTIAAWRSEKGDPAKMKVDYLIEKRGDGSGALILRRGSEEQTIPLNVSQFRNFFPGIAQPHPLQEALASATFSTNKTTNVAGIKDSSGAPSAFYTANDLPTGISNGPLANIVKFDIEGASSNSGLNTDEYLIRMYVFDQKTGLWKDDLLSYDYMNSDQIIPKLQQVSAKVVGDFLKK